MVPYLLLALVAATDPDSPAQVVLSPDGSAVTFMSWDTEGGNRLQTNLLKNPVKAVIARARAESGGKTVAAPVQFSVEMKREGFDLTVPMAHNEALRLVFPFDPAVTPTTVLPAAFDKQDGLRLPAIISAPDFGQMLVTLNTKKPATSRLLGSRKDKTLEWIVELPQTRHNAPLTLQFRSVRLPQPQGLHDEARWRLARRGWFNAFNLTSRWGDQTGRHSAPVGILGNNVLSDPASLSLWMYADMALFMPKLATGIDSSLYLRRSLDHWLDNRMLDNGNLIAYWDYDTFLDPLPSILISAWDYVEAANDRAWLKRRIGALEKIGAYALTRDVDGDGLIEAVPTGNRGTLFKESRSSCWFDAANFGWKDAYTNALMYRAFCCLADLNGKLGRSRPQTAWLDRAAKLKQAYGPALTNPKTGWIAMWRSQDGELHDYASPIINGYAIEYGLVDAEKGRRILDSLHAKMKEAGFSNFQFGVPCWLNPVTPDDYLQPAIGAPQQPDGLDTWQIYMNGAITAGHVYHFLAAHYAVGTDAGMNEQADAILDAMLATQDKGGFQNGVKDEYPKGIDWRKWNGDPCGYEGFLADNARFLLAVLTRNPQFRERLYRPLLTP
ncbi:MAG: hypothetical protein NTZ09_16975 [Candidatus Hydrogenedentes bacterium]|nr:hypothetical protein [Candidatus Hydrogenedentota bacterium]